VAGPVKRNGYRMRRIPHGPMWSIMTLVAVFAAFTPTDNSTYRPASSAVASPLPTAASSTAVKGQVPDLVMLPLETFHLGRDNGRLVIRFSSLVENRGGGPFEVLGSRPSVNTPDLKVVQNMHQTNGQVRRIPTKAVMRYSLRDGHHHFHVQNFEEFKLRPVGSTIWRGGHKEGFCVRDSGRQHGERPKQYSDCGDREPQLLKVKEGLSVGWVDNYEWHLWGQFIYLDGLHIPGNFCISATADPLNLFTEKTRANNTTSTLVRITSQHVQVIRQGC
jgi:Lysyl oxidase